MDDILMADLVPNSNDAYAQPPPVSAYGDDFVNISIGHHASKKKFAIHIGLICLASEFFDDELIDDEGDVKTNRVDLPNECPAIFQVFYQWLYVGKISHHASDYGDVALDDELFWLNVHQMAERLKARALQGIAFQRLQIQFGRSEAPTSAFILELYNDANNSEFLKKYIVRHCAFCIHSGNLPNWTPWASALAAHPSLASQVNEHIVKLSSLDYTGPRIHPIEDPSQLLPDDVRDDDWSEYTVNTPSVHGEETAMVSHE